MQPKRSIRHRGDNVILDIAEQLPAAGCKKATRTDLLNLREKGYALKWDAMDVCTQ
jgi:hypothetical protein